MDTQKIEEQLKLINVGIKEVHAKCDVAGKEASETKEMAEKASKDVTEAMDRINKDKKVDELKARIADLEQLVATTNGTSIATPYNTPEIKTYNEELLKYLRHSKFMTDNIEQKALSFEMRPRLYGADEDRLSQHCKTMAAGSGPDGGYFIVAERASDIVKRNFETTPLRGLARSRTTASNVLEIIIRDDEAGSGWVGETTARPKTTTAKLGIIQIPIKEIYANPAATQNMLDDAGFDLAGMIAEDSADIFTREENRTFTVGNAAFEPKGFLTYDNWAVAGEYERGKVEQIKSGVNGSFTGDSFIRIQNELHEVFQANATWGMRRDTFTKVMTLKDKEDRYLLVPFLLGQGTEKVLLGNTVTFMHDMPKTGNDLLAVTIADWSRFYTIVDRFGIRTLRDPYTEKPNVLFYTTKRVGGAVTDYQAGKIMVLSE